MPYSIKADSKVDSLLTAKDLSSATYLDLGVSNYAKNYIKMDGVEAIIFGGFLGVLRAYGTLTGPWLLGSTYSIDDIPEAYVPAFTVGGKTMDGDADVQFYRDSRRIMINPKKAYAAGDSVQFYLFYPLKNRIGGGGYLNRLFSRFCRALKRGIALA